VFLPRRDGVTTSDLPITVPPLDMGQKLLFLGLIMLRFFLMLPPCLSPALTPPLLVIFLDDHQVPL